MSDGLTQALKGKYYKSRIIVYTAIFGGYDTIHEPTIKLPNVEYIMFTDQNIKSDIWNVRKVNAIYKDPTRNARKYKLLPHRWFPDYEYSIWVDGNIIVRDNVNEIIDRYLKKTDVAVFDHNQNKLDPRNCVYEEAKVILYLGQLNRNYKDDPALIIKQMEKYEADRYPANNGLVVSMIVARRHNVCKKAMEKWWEELKYNTKRDQLSFNYSMWKTDTNVTYIPGDSRDNKWFYHTGAHNKK